MSFSRWIIDPALGLTILLSVGVLFYISLDAVALKTEQRISEQYDKERKAHKSDGEITEFCARFAGIEGIKCAVDEVEAREKWDQERRDLHAQEGMARWAFWMFLAAASGTVVAAYGLILLRRTWVETKRSADIANRAFMMSERPHLFFGNIQAVEPLFEDFWDFTNTPSIDSFEVTFDVENHGKTPAVIEEIRSHVHIDALLPSSPFFHSGEISEYETVIPGGKSKKAAQMYRGTITPDELRVIQSTRNVYIEGAAECRVYFYAFVKYTGIFGIKDEVMSVFRYDPLNGDFLPESNSAFNYRKLEDGHDQS